MWHSGRPKRGRLVPSNRTGTELAAPAQGVWEKGEQPSVGARHILMLTGLILIGAIVGAFGSISFPLGFGGNFFWTGIAVQQVGSIWFGAWGVLAGVIFPFFSNALAGTPFYVSAAYIPANLVQSLLPAWAFRRFDVSTHTPL